MIKKRLFLALIAMSMSLVGCDKVNTLPVDDTPTTDPTDVDPEGKGGESGGESGGETGGGESQDRLTPEQRTNANKFETAFTVGLMMAKEDPKEVKEYITKYSEEIALKNYTSENLQSIIDTAGTVLTNITDLSSITADDVVNLLLTLNEEGLLDETVYFAVAFAKTYGRAYAKGNESYEAGITYLVDKIDEEGYNIPENLYESVNILMTSYKAFTSSDLENAIDSVYNEETNELSAESTKQVLALSSEALLNALEIRDNIKYFANFLVKLTDTKIEDETGPLTRGVSSNEPITVDGIIDKIFNGISFLAGIVNALGDENNKILDPLFPIVNLFIQKQYAKAITDSLSLIIQTGLNILGLGDDFEDAKANAVSVYQLVKSTVDSFLDEELLSKIKDLIVEETGLINIDTLKEVIPQIKTILESLTDLNTNISYFDSLLVKCVETALTRFLSKTQQEAEEYAAKFDISNEIAAAFSYLEKVLEILDGIDEEFYDFISYVNDKDYMNIARVILNKVLTYVGSKTTFEDFAKDVSDVKEIIEDVIGAFASEEFAAKINALVNESGEIDIEKLNALIVEIGETLEDLLDAKEGILDFADKLVEVIRTAMLKFLVDPEYVEEVLSQVDVDAIIEGCFAKLEYLARLIKSLPEMSSIDDYVELVNLFMPILNVEDPSEAITPVANFSNKLFEILFNTFEIEKEPETFTSYIMSIFALGYLTYLQVTNESFINSAKAIVDLETGEIDFEALESFLYSIGNLISPFYSEGLLNVIYEFIDVGREIISKLGKHKEADPELHEIEPEVEHSEELEEEKDELKEAVAKVVAVIKEISDFLKNENHELEGYLAFVEGIYDLIMGGLANIALIADNPDIEPAEKANQIFDIALGLTEDVAEALKPMFPEAAIVERYLDSRYVEFAKDLICEVVNVNYNGIYAVSKDFLLELASYLALAFIPNTRIGSASSNNWQYFDEQEMPGVLPIKEMSAALNNKEDGEWNFEGKLVNIAFHKVHIPDGEGGEIFEYELWFNTLRSYSITNEVIDDENHLDVDIKWDFIYVVIPSLDAIPQTLLSLVLIPYFMSGDIDAAIEEVAGYVNQFIEMYNAFKEGEEEALEPSELDQIIAIIEEFAKEDGALVKQLYKDVLMALASLIAPFVPNDGETAKIDVTLFIFNALLRHNYIPYNSYSEEQINAFKALIADIYNVAALIGYEDELFNFVNEHLFGGSLSEVESVDEFVGLFDSAFSMLQVLPEVELGE